MHTREGVSIRNLVNEKYSIHPVAKNGQVHFAMIYEPNIQYNTNKGERGGLMVNASDSGSRGRGFEPHSGQTVLCP